MSINNMNNSVYKKHVLPTAILFLILGLAALFTTPIPDPGFFNYFPLPVETSIMNKKIVIILVALMMIGISVGLINRKFWSWIALFFFVGAFHLYTAFCVFYGFMAIEYIPLGLSPNNFASIQVAGGVIACLSFYFLQKPVFVKV
tara:strand:- start:1789 stop:2223 length:435 start_codon:yes stop_codon:yes gene_type:complete